MSKIRLQHDDVIVSDLYGRECNEFLAVRNSTTNQIGPMYAKISDGWHRFYLDAGILFWEEGSPPDPENDLLDNDHYFDVARELRSTGSRIAKIEMRNCELTIAFDNQAQIRLTNDIAGDWTIISEFTPG